MASKKKTRPSTSRGRDEDADQDEPTPARTNPPSKRSSGAAGGASDDDEPTSDTESRNPFGDEERSSTAARGPKLKGRRPLADDDDGIEPLPSHADDEPMAGALSLEGDGLEPMDIDGLTELRRSRSGAKGRTGGAGQGASDEAEDGDEGDEGDGGLRSGSGEREDDADDEPSDVSDGDDANATQAGRPVKLEIVDGPGKGKKRRVKGVRMVIGRAPGCDFRLRDQSVSRRHVEVVQSDAGVLLRDLGSGNGTKVNGEKLSEKMLAHGDEIAIGKTTLRFFDEVAAVELARAEAEKAIADAELREEAASAALAAAEASAAESAAKAQAGQGGPPGGVERTVPGVDTESLDRAAGRGNRGSRAVAWFRGLSIRARAALVAGATLLAALIVFGVASRPPPSPPDEPGKAEAELLLQRARTAARAHDYRKAARLVDDAEHLVAGIDKTKFGPQVREAAAIQRQMDNAAGFLDEQRYDEARKALLAIPTANLLPHFDSVKRGLEARLAGEMVGFQERKLEQALAAGELETAKALLNELPAERRAPLQAKIGEFEERLEAQRRADEAQAQQERQEAQERAGGAGRQAPAPGVGALRKDEQHAIALAAVERKFANAEWARAASECTRVIDDHRTDRELISRAKALQAQLPLFGSAYEEGARLYKQGQMVDAAKPLRTAWRLLQEMGLKSNTYGAELSAKLAQAGIAAGNEALRRDDLVAAAESFRAVASVDPSDPRARKGLEEAAVQAEELFKSAYIMRDREPREATRRFRVIVAVTPAGSETHEKAKKQLALIAP